VDQPRGHDRAQNPPQSGRARRRGGWVEMAQAYSALGSTVTLLEAAERLLTREEPFAGEQLHEALVERGVDVRVGVEARAVRRDGASVTVDLSDGERVEATKSWWRLGVVPGPTIWASKPSASSRESRLPSMTRCVCRGLPWLYAIGDVNERWLLTHIAKYQAHVACEVIDGGQARATRDGGGAPRVVFTDPQVAAVGLTLQAAKDQRLNARAYDVLSSATAGAGFYGRDTPGTSRLVVDEDRGVIVGATFTGTDVADWLHAATIALVGEIPVERLWEAVPAFPARSEIWLNLLEKRETELAREPGGQTHGVAAG